MFCSNCGKEIKDGSKFCDGCGASLEGQTTQEQSSKKKMHGCLKAFLIFIGVIFGLGIIGGLIGDGGQNSTSPSSNSVAPKLGLELVDSGFCKLEFGTRAVCGTVKNNSNKTYSYAQVSINLYDANENIIGSTLANINNLEPQKQWKFQAVVMEDNAKSYKVQEITGF